MLCFFLSRVLVTAVLGDRNPCELFFFRNYTPPGRDHEQMYKTSGPFEPPPRPHGKLCYQIVAEPMEL